MTPDARLSSAIEILDGIRTGENAERLLTGWARANRYAGSKDRAAIRDHVFDALRCLRSYGWLGGAGEGTATGRQLIIGALRAAGIDPQERFTGAGYAPAPLAANEVTDTKIEDAPRAVRIDCPDWLLPLFEDALGGSADAVLDKFRHRAPVFLRVNRRKATLGHAIESLQADRIEARPHPLSESALEVTQGARAVARSQAYLTGLVELQDAASQAIIDMLPLEAGDSVLDFCAGGGGKALAMGATADVELTAHDIDPARMQDIAPRASRAGLNVTIARSEDLQPSYDFVLCDAPCSGAGSWARAPQAKWLLTQERLDALVELQSSILDEACEKVGAGGHLAYATCSVLEAENAGQTAAFLARHREFKLIRDRLVSPLEGGDGFYIALFSRD
ncbi:RsmB/NOP family class I SAM-dependent RNA methyltransferase [Celeribacter arenosi]|uniref:RsmB/NOP family class I SAM-dependent RNA methyltransferase n=1 Tax=Celeribacter arenosi TaxID=792649 RepID=A0ABP7KH42_9RHOB